MNYRIVARVIGRILCIEAGLMLLPAAVALIYGESVWPWLGAAAITAAAGLLLCLFKPESREYYAREGFVSVAVSWLLMSVFGALPFIFCGDIPRFADAFFEMVSGFTTTGSSILPNVELMSYGTLFWRSFSHWVGGMGVLMFMMAIMPMNEEYSMHLMRAEVPGPVKGKLVPKMRRTARLLYLIYMGLTVVLVGLLLLGGMPLFDSLLHAFGTAGTGGFGIKATSVGWYGSAYIDWVIGIFMLIFGVNFNLYYLVLLRRSLKAMKSEELFVYLVLAVFAALTMALNLRPLYGGFGEALRHSFFQTSSVMTTTGYATADFNLWPAYSKTMLVVLMFTGACAGSTAGGMKISRVVIAAKACVAEIRRQVTPRSVSRVSMDGERLDAKAVHTSCVFLLLYIALLLVSMLVLSMEGLDFETTFTSVLTCISNVGPGLGLVGPMGCFDIWSEPAKLLLSFCMLLGRLEIFPVIMLLAPSTWRRSP